MFERMVEDLATLLPGFNERAAIGGKALPSFAKHQASSDIPGGRRDTDADYSKKTYRGKHKDGTPWQKAVRWFGYPPHLVVDEEYELLPRHDGARIWRRRCRQLRWPRTPTWPTLRADCQSP